MTTTTTPGQLSCAMCGSGIDPHDWTPDENGCCCDCNRRDVYKEYGRRQGSAAALGAAMDIAMDTHDDDEIRAPVELCLARRSEVRHEIDDMPLRPYGWSFSEAEAMCRTDEEWAS